MKLPSPTETNLLNALGPREISGRELAERYKQEGHGSISWGTLYTAMRRLKEAGWVEVREDEVGDRRMRYFKISANGAIALPKVLSMQEQLAGWRFPV